ncbi:hypothetical protein O181_064146 [Austropuccinia psidii MF-1]|uniref:Uncharacterized protein n=1 Tax=Austropuccinia psidii MF-1 TaxID=1389203 RepID=A0A9Q3ELD4_9BASI|nr:hypothetical protein [Austropuccinia psidii MF-1]
MDVTLEPNTRYHERQKEKKNYQEKNTEPSKSSSSHTQNSSSSSHNKRNLKVQKRDKLHYSLLNKDQRLMGFEKERILKEGFCAYCGGKNGLEACIKRPIYQPEGRFPTMKNHE